GGQNVLKAQGRAEVKVGLEKTAEARPDLHAGQDAARVLVERTHQAGAVLHRRFAHPRVETGAEGNVAHIATGPHDHCPASADVDDLLSFVDIAVAPVALQPFAGHGTDARRVACLDTDNPAGIATLADDFVHVPVEHEPDASLAGGVFNGAGDDEAAPYAVGSTKGVGPRAGATADLRAGVEGLLSFPRGAAGVCRGDGPRLDVRLGAELHDRTSGPGLGHAAALVGTANARKANVVVHQELAGRSRVVGPPALVSAIVVAIVGNRVVVDDRPVGCVNEQRLGVISHIRGRQQWGGQPSVGVGKAASVALLDGVAAAERR